MLDRVAVKAEIDRTLRELGIEQVGRVAGREVLRAGRRGRTGWLHEWRESGNQSESDCNPIAKKMGGRRTADRPSLGRKRPRSSAKTLPEESDTVVARMRAKCCAAKRL